MDKSWLLRAAAYVELNPVNAGIVKQAWKYRWSSVHAHLSGVYPEGIVCPVKQLSLTGDWKAYLKIALAFQYTEVERHELTGRPLGKDRFIERA